MYGDERFYGQEFGPGYDIPFSVYSSRGSFEYFAPAECWDWDWETFPARPEMKHILDKETEHFAYKLRFDQNGWGPNLGDRYYDTCTQIKYVTRSYGDTADFSHILTVHLPGNHQAVQELADRHGQIVCMYLESNIDNLDFL